MTGHLRLIWASKRWLALFAVVAAVVVYLVSGARTDQYESKALGQIISTTQASGEILSEEQLLSLSNIYHELAETRSVAVLAHEDPAVKGKESEFNSSVEVEPESRVGVLGFRATTPDPIEAAAFANAYANAFARYLGELKVDQLTAALKPLNQRIEEVESELAEAPTGLSATGLRIELQALQDQVAAQTSNPGDTMRIVERAVPSNSPASPRPLRDAVLALIAALVLGASVIYLRDILFDRYRSSQEAARDLGLQLLGEVPKARSGSALESFRSLRTAIVFSLERSSAGREFNGSGTEEAVGSVLITGAESGCGKSYVAANLSRALAAEGRTVTLVDADLRRPTLHEVFSTPLSPGLSELLVGDKDPDPEKLAIDVHLGSGGGAPLAGELRLLPAGAHSGDSVESLSSDNMKSAVMQLRARNEAIVFDSPPTLVVVDPVVLARYVDGVVFVIDSRRTRRRDARRAVEALRATGAPLIGFTFNRSSARQTRYDAYRPREPRRQALASKETGV
jgi:capsular exopolysaccharide synthesis family protein